MNKHELILDFIQQFRNLGAENCFSNGMCYWFAQILKQRFGNHGIRITYDEVINHFGCEIDGKVYDITGEVPEGQYHWTYWDKMFVRDPLLTQRILRDCRDHIPSRVVVCEYCEECFRDDTLGNCLCSRDNLPVDVVSPCQYGKEKN